MKVVIMRGMTGAGKTTWVAALKKSIEAAGGTITVLSADRAHEVNGVYKFDPAKKAEAHNACLHRAATIMRNTGADSSDVLVIDNTNTTAWEISPYYRLAEVYGHDVEIVRIHCDFAVAAQRNIHEVPTSVAWAMYQAILSEKLPSWWKESIVFPEETNVSN